MIKIKMGKPMDKEGAVVVILNENDETLILLRPAHAHWAPRKWGYPGGKMEEGEHPTDTAIRETKEETQLVVTDLRPINLDSGKDGVENASVWSYYTRNYQGEVVIDHEHDDWVWVDNITIKNYPLAPGAAAMYDWAIKNGN